MNIDVPEIDPRRKLCREAIDFLQAFMDGDQPAETPEILEHRLQCLQCREEFQLAKMLLNQTLPLDIQPGHLLEKATQSVLQDRRKSTVRRRLAWISIPMAASIALAIFLNFGRNPSQVTGDSSTTVAMLPAKPIKATEKQIPLNIDESISEARKRFESLTEKVVAVRPEMNVVLPKIDENPSVDPAWDRLADAGDGLKSSVKPLATSAKRAVSMFLNATDALSLADSTRKN